MTINISSKQMDVTPAIRTHIEERLAKLEKWQTQLINPHFMIHNINCRIVMKLKRLSVPRSENFLRRQITKIYI